MFILKHLKTLQHVAIIIQIIFKEVVCSLLKSLILKFVKNVKSQCGDAASPAYLSAQNACTHTKCYAAASVTLTRNIRAP